MSSLIGRLPLADRIAVLSRREKIFLGVGTAAIFLFLFIMFRPEPDESGVELASPPAAQAATPVPAPAEADPAPAPAPTAASMDGIFLQSVLGGGGGGSAILLMPGGQQRLVRVGRQFLPGLTLKEVGLKYAIIGSSGGDVRIELGRTGTAPAAAQAPPASAGPPAGAANHARETMAYRLGMQPVRSGNGIRGYVIKGNELPHLARAGLRPGDIVVGVNGSALDEERLMELSWEIANSPATEFEVIRDGQRIKAKLN